MTKQEYLNMLTARLADYPEDFQKEIEEANGESALEPGTEVVINADHMEGMKGATAVIDSSEKTTVYLIDYTPTDGSDKVTNHKWVTEEELSKKE